MDVTQEGVMMQQTFWEYGWRQMGIERIFSELKVSAVKWAGKIRHGKFSRKESWVVLHSNISAKLKYPLPMCTLTKQRV